MDTNRNNTAPPMPATILGEWEGKVTLTFHFSGMTREQVALMLANAYSIPGPLLGFMRGTKTEVLEGKVDIVTGRILA
jgi:hypothetical protein